MKHEWRKKEKSLYQPRTEPQVVEVPAFKFISISLTDPLLLTLRTTPGHSVDIRTQLDLVRSANKIGGKTNAT